MGSTGAPAARRRRQAPGAQSMRRSSAPWPVNTRELVDREIRSGLGLGARHPGLRQVALRGRATRAAYRSPAATRRRVMLTMFCRCIAERSAMSPSAHSRYSSI